MFERKRAAREKVMDAFVASLLQPGETVRGTFAAQSRARWGWLTVPVYPFAFWLGLTGRGFVLLGAAVLACLAFVLLFVLRYYWIVLTDRRALVFVWRHLWSKATEEVLEGPRRAGSPTHAGGKLSSHVTLEVGERILALDVPRAYKERVAAEVAEAGVGSRACALAPGGDRARVRWQVTHLPERDA